MQKYIKQLLVLGLLTAVGFAGWCQENAVSGKKLACPLNGGAIEKYGGPYIISGEKRLPNTTILGKDSLVFNVKSGSVEAIFMVEDVRVVMIRNGKFFYTYSNLDTVFVRRGQEVKVRGVIGICSGKSLEFLISDSSDRYYEPEQYLDCRAIVKK